VSRLLWRRWTMLRNPLWRSKASNALHGF